MSINRIMKRKGPNHTRQLIGLLLLIACHLPLVRAQQNPEAQPEQVALSKRDLYKARGELLAKGNNKLPVGALKVKSYRLEEVKLPHPLESGGGKSKLRVESALRLVVTLDTALNDGYIIWINDLAFEAAPTKHIGLEGSKESELSVLFYGMPFEDGAEISVSEYDSGPNPKALSILPERLRVPARLKATRLENPPNNNAIKLRSIPSTGPLRGKDGVEVELTTSGHNFEARNAMPILQIGKQDVATGYASGYKAVFRLTKEQFASAKDGGMIIVKFGFGVGGGVLFGRLDKSLLDK